MEYVGIVVLMKKIVIVEDDLLQGLFLKKAMAHLGYEVVGSAITGAHAIDLAIELCPDIILMDVNLGGEKNGVETATQILNKVDCFIIFITGNLDKNLMEQACQIQSSKILLKPITGKMIKTAIDIHFSTLG